MQVPRRILQITGHLPAAEAPEPMAVDSDVVVILAGLLCALICVVGLALVARCAWLRHSFPPSSSSSPPPPPPNKGVKKKVLRSLPKLAFHPGAAAAKLADCPICLADFAEGDEIRILPQCGHGFHVSCVDTWLGSHSSCPSCRQILVVGAPAAVSASAATCQKCGATSGEAGQVSIDVPPAAEPQQEADGGSKAREDADRVLP